MRESKHTPSDHPEQDGFLPLEPIDVLQKCVWSGVPSYESSCRAHIPASVVVRAWQREMRLSGSDEGFFRFSWRSGVWLGYGLSDGQVRGVYCPTHCAERESRGSRRHLARAD